MNRSFVLRCSTVLALLAGLGCGNDASEALALASARGIEITMAADVSSGAINGSGLQGTIRNISGQTVYTRAGDAFNGATEQDPVYTSFNSDAIVEGKNSYGAWTQLDAGVMIEGTKYIALLPGKTYRLVSMISAPSFRGQARVRINYSTAPNSSGTVGVDYSNVFEIR